MTKCIPLLSITLVMLSCSSSVEDQNQLIGHWSQCLRDGSYQEQIFSDNKIYILNEFTTEDEIGTYHYNILNDSLIAFGITKNTYPKDTFRMHIKVVSAKRITVSNQDVQYNLVKIKGPTSGTDIWIKNTLTGFNLRKEKFGCQDIRTKEEKELIDLGTLEDDFEELTEIPFIEELDSLKNN